MIRKTFASLIALLLLTSVGVSARQAQRRQQPTISRTPTPREAGTARSLEYIKREVRHELATLPWYGVFDWLEYQVQPDGTVILSGQVVRPTTKSDAEARVKEIEGVSRVVNNIEVLPLSPQDDRLRIALYRAIYNWDSPLFRYAVQAIPPIHIIVKNGRATLKGVVASEADSQLAYAAARSVPGLFEVTNELRVEGSEKRS
ncbi:BON domain-containing protein [Pyrinomonas methylaliphatogenes]|jgi:hyperosmotically inducible protein|uniref:Predicted periplasmic or secreted lipoprotein n=1 Tax=Pyrinomonas methylaliphatogenes TaxID=454194 RepID=A0A0B6WYS3_9BACT|nr:BON domain-containing protein [Pyrinomonas methylaliphatogenes]MBX5478384.1 BON domain-containing protein [Pyrinomonas methylaliphatogenes]CDM66413.1 predicted periplasmic or secreted lipoprotein [Pyrinomonas methylaliphatogenes]